MPSAHFLHGGPDAQGVPLHDFSSNANACGPCPEALAAVQQADASRYPDPMYTALRESLGAFHAVSPERIVLAASASEGIHRFTALAALQGAQAVSVPNVCYGDYAQAAQARGLAVQRGAWEGAALQWACQPASPLGNADSQCADWQRAAAAQAPAPLRVLDCAYAPLRLDGAPLPGDTPGVWQLWTPNKALGLTGVRGAYAIAPPQVAPRVVQRLNALAPSWPLGAHGVALLETWTHPGTQAWLASSLATLREWKLAQQALCAFLGWQEVPGSLANYFVCQLPVADVAGALAGLRRHDIKLRDCASLGLPGHVRLGVLSPAAQRALKAAWHA